MTTIDITPHRAPRDAAASRSGHPGNEHRFAAMGTRVHVIVEGNDTEWLINQAVDEIDRLEQLWSRFRPTSEIRQLNASAGHTVTVDPATIDLVDRAVSGWHLTGGRFDPTLLPQLVDLGYDRSFDEIGLRSDRPGQPSTVRQATVEQTAALTAITAATCAEITIDRSASSVRLPPALTLDPGGIGKGLAADRVTARLIDLGATRALVNIGGDLRIRSTDPAAEPWAVRVEESSCREAPPTTVSLVDGGVATSTTQKRRWSTPDGERHHVLDPATGRPRVDGPILTTVIAADAWWAEVAATAALDLQCPSLPGAITRRVFDDGTVGQDPNFHRYERPMR